MRSVRQVYLTISRVNEEVHNIYKCEHNNIIKDGIGVASLSARPHIMASTIDSDPAHEGLPITHAELLARIVAVESRLRRTVENQIRFEEMASRLLSEINAINDRCSETDKICTDNWRDIVVIDNNVSTLNARVEEGYDDLKAHCARIATLYHRRYRQVCDGMSALHASMTGVLVSVIYLY